jgi:hypothetical protein
MKGEGVERLTGMASNDETSRKTLKAKNRSDEQRAFEC